MKLPITDLYNVDMLVQISISNYFCRRSTVGGLTRRPGEATGEPTAIALAAFIFIESTKVFPFPGEGGLCFMYDFSLPRRERVGDCSNRMGV